LFDGKNITFDASLVIYINSINIPPIMIINRISGVLINPWPDLLPDVFCLMVRIFRTILYFIYINSTNIPRIMIINRIYETQNLLSL
jgi:hypothetical protein